MTEKSWFILRYNHFPPDTFIKLGQLVTNPKEPNIPIAPDGPLDFPSNMISVSSVEEGFHWEASSGHDEHLTLSAEMDGLPVSGEIKAEFKKKVRNWADFTSLETQLIGPTKQYVEESMGRPLVAETLGKNILQKSVFMVTGLKIAKKGERGVESARSKELGFKVGVTPTPSIPISLGPDVGGDRKTSETLKSTAANFVWAFSLRQIYYRMGKVVKAKTYDDGATLEDRSDEEDDDEDDEEQNPRAVPSPELRVDGLDLNTFSGENSNLVNVTEKSSCGRGEVILTIEGL
jgi:hypothetical protein